MAIGVKALVGGAVGKLRASRKFTVFIYLEGQISFTKACLSFRGYSGCSLSNHRRHG